MSPAPSPTYSLPATRCSLLPREPLAIDFETFYAPGYDVRSLGLDRYLSDRRFDCYLVAIVGAGFAPFVGHPKDAPWHALHGRTLVAHHAAFDRSVFLRLQALGVIPTDVQPAEWHCTADLAAYLQSPRALDNASRELLGIIVDKSVRDAMRGVNWLQARLTLGNDTVHTYARRDAEACLRLWQDFASHWPESERRLSQFTRDHAEHGVRVDAEEVARSIITLTKARAAAARQLPWAGRAPPTSSKALAAECRVHGIPQPPSTSEDNAACDEWEERWGTRFPWVTAIRTWRKINRLLRVLETLRDRTRPDGTLRAELKYFGAAATGRWAGASGLNLQNFNREAFEGVDARRCLRARPGHRLIIADLSQIEPRCLAWLSGDVDLLTRIREGMPLYEAHARETMGWKGGTLKTANPQLYLLAKCRILGLGYGAGPRTFQRLAQQAGLDISPDAAAQTVAEFRAVNSQITILWRSLERAMSAVADGKHSPRDAAFRTSPAHTDLPAAPHSLLANSRTYFMRLPSGRYLRYFDVQRDEAGRLAATTERGGRAVAWYGGKLVENLVQATARDVFAEGLLRIADAGIRVLWTVHDEVICEVPNASDVTPDTVCSLLAQTPSWMPGLPLAAEARTADYYGK